MTERRITLEELLCYFSIEKKNKIKVNFKCKENEFCRVWKDISEFFEKPILFKSDIQLFKHLNKIYLWIPSTENTKLGIEFCSISSLRKCEIYVQDFEKCSQFFLKIWKDIYVCFLKHKCPTNCPDAFFLTLLNFTEKLCKKMPFFHLPVGLHWCEEDKTLEINYVDSFICLFVELGKYSLYDVRLNQSYDVEDEILLQMVNKICITL